MKIFQKTRINDEREIKLFGKPFIHYFRKKHPKSKELYISFFPKQSLKERFKDCFDFNDELISYELDLLEDRLKKFDFDDAYIFASASGETFFTMQYFDQICKKMGSRKPLLISNKPYGDAIFKMFYPDAETKKLFSILFDIAEPMKPLSINNHRYIFPFTKSYFSELEKKHKNGEDCHFYQNLLQNFKLDSSIRQTPVISKRSQDNVDRFIKKSGLGDNFIIISSQAASNDTCSHWFWEELTNAVRDLGYQVFHNDASCGLDMAEYYWLASKSKAVIGVRSGALDLCADVSPLTIAYYLPFKNRGDWPPIRASYVMKNFSLSLIPGCTPSNIHEFDIGESGEYKALEETLRLVTHL